MPHGDKRLARRRHAYHPDALRQLGRTEVRLRQSGRDHYNIVAAHSDKYLDVPNGSTADGEPINQHGCDGSDEQRYRRPDRSTGGGVARFTIYRGYDLFGVDFASYANMTNYQACMSACGKNSRCKAFTYNVKAARCFLKSQTPSPTPFADAISGIRK